jgi:hypothetical protein
VLELLIDRSGIEVEGWLDKMANRLSVVLGARRDEVTEKWRRIHNEGLRNYHRTLFG